MPSLLKASISALCVALATGLAQPSFAASRLKDIVDIEGVRENQLIGYGLVVGLNGSGDSLRNSPFTRQSLEAMLERLGVNTRDQNLNTKNVAEAPTLKWNQFFRTPWANSVEVNIRKGLIQKFCQLFFLKLT